jgi:hypothetical protein
MQTGRYPAVPIDEAASHVFRRSLPAHVLVPMVEDAVLPGWRLTLSDCREFLMAYCAMFLAVSAFIS